MKKLKIEKLSSLFYNLAIANVGINMETTSILIPIALEEKRRSDEFKKMNIIEIEFDNKNKREIEYRELDKIKRFTKKFLKKNPKWICEKESTAGIKTGRLIFTRIYRRYRKKYIEEDYCEECGREY